MMSDSASLWRAVVDERRAVVDEREIDHGALTKRTRSVCERAALERRRAAELRAAAAELRRRPSPGARVEIWSVVSSRSQSDPG